MQIRKGLLKLPGADIHGGILKYDATTWSESRGMRETGPSRLQMLCVGGRMKRVGTRVRGLVWVLGTRTNYQ